MSTVSNAEVVGGIPLVSVIGTPRTMGEHLGSRLKSRLQVLAQYFFEQLTSASAGSPQPMTVDDLRARLRDSMLPLTRHEPALWMEIESMARAADMREEDLLLVHGYGDLLSHYGFQVPPGRSTFLSLAAPHTDTGLPRLVMAWHLDPALLPYVMLLRRIPAHGPASLSLTLAGLSPICGLSEAGIAAAVNELRVTDGADGHFTCHLLASTLTAPSLDDAASRAAMGPRHGGAALHLLSNGGDRLSLELSGQTTARLDDPYHSAPRVHTNHPLHSDIIKHSALVNDATSKARLERVAGLAVDASGATPNAIAGWFGLEGKGDRPSARLIADPNPTPEVTVLFMADPAAKAIHVRRGGTSAKLETVRL